MAVVGRAGGRVSYRGVAVALALVALGGVAVASLRGVVGQFLGQGLALTPLDLLALLPFAVWSYGLRVARWHVLLRRLAPRLPLARSLHTQLVGFAFATSPGRIAELYKLRMLERAVGLPIARSLPAVAVERLTDVAAFGSLAAAGGWLSWGALGGGGSTARWALPGLGLLGLAAVYQVGVRRWSEWRSSAAVAGLRAGGRRLAARLPVGARLLASLERLQSGAARVASPGTLAVALACVVLGRLGDAVVVWQVARLVGHPLPLATAMVLIAAAGLAGGFSLLPGGVGAAEATLAGLAYAHGVPLEAAVSLALLSRIVIYWLWIALGLAVFAVGAGRGAVARR